METGQAQAQNQHSQFQSAPTAPPPPQEIKVRTMKSDMESMAKNGGGLPTFETMKLSGSPSSIAAANGGSSGFKRWYIIALIAVAAIAALALLGFFVYSFIHF